MKFNLQEVKFSKADILKGIRLPTQMSLDLAEEIGLHLGDGSMNYYSNKGENKGFYQLRGHIIDDRPHYLNRIQKLYKILFNLNVSIRDMKSTGVLGFQIWSNALVNFKHKILKLPLGKKRELEVPKVIYTKSLFFAFMRGLFDTDGSIYFENKRGKPYPRIDIKTISKTFCYQINDLLRKNEINSTTYEYKRKDGNRNNLYSIIVRGYPMIRIWNKYIFSANPKHIKKLKLVA